jgi:hypothetical protein
MKRMKTVENLSTTSLGILGAMFEIFSRQFLNPGAVTEMSRSSVASSHHCLTSPVPVLRKWDGQHLNHNSRGEHTK